MQRTPVKSSNIKEVGYDEKSKIFEVMFNNGAVYQHLEVPKEVYVGFQGALSKGKYYADKINNKFKTYVVKPH